MKSKTLVIGASENTARYSNKAIHALIQKKHDVIAIGKRKGNINGVQIETELKLTETVATVSLYINSKIQEDYKDFIIDLKPKRVIFNPGTENSEFQKQLEAKGIQALEACTLVLLATNQY